MSFAALTRKEIETLLKKVQGIAALLKDVNDILASESNDPSDPEDNVIHIVPGLMQQFERNQKVKMTVVDVITLYENWTKALYEATINNKGHMQNRAIKKHMQEAYHICRSVEQILKNLMNA